MSGGGGIVRQSSEFASLGGIEQSVSDLMVGLNTTSVRHFGRSGGGGSSGSRAGWRGPSASPEPVAGGGGGGIAEAELGLLLSQRAGFTVGRCTLN